MDIRTENETMAKQHAVFEHTADIGVAAQADTLAELFEALAEGLAAVICEPGSVNEVERRALEVREEEPDLEGLAVDFLWQVLTLAMEERFLLHGIRVNEIDASHVEAEAAGEPYAPGRHELLSEVKAVTWHQLRVVEHEGRWEARVIQDL